MAGGLTRADIVSRKPNFNVEGANVTDAELARLERLERDNRRLKGFALAVVVLAATSLMLPVVRPAVAQTKPYTETSPHVDADALCSFITQRMQSALPQVPTLCSPISTELSLAIPNTLSVSAFSPTDVLEGKMRRAWSTALFQTFQTLFYGGALDGACGLRGLDSIAACELRVSDSSMSGVYYDVLSPTHGDLQRLRGGDLASDDTYFQWWQVLFLGKEARHPEWMSKGNAELVAQNACEDFADRIRHLNSLSPKSDESGLPVPTCTVVMATNRSVAVALDFPDLVSALVLNYAFELPNTFGKAFDGTAYDGDVIFRSPWNESGNRTYIMYSLGDLELAWEEFQSSGNTAPIPTGTFTGERGVEQRNTCAGMDSGGAVVKITPVSGTDRVLADLTNGGEWSIKQEVAARYSLKPGSEVFVGWTQAGNSKNRQYILFVGNHVVPADFVQGW